MHMPKVIILSALGQDNITQNSLTLGADYYIIKPFDLDVLIIRMRMGIVTNVRPWGHIVRISCYCFDSVATMRPDHSP